MFANFARCGLTLMALSALLCLGQVSCKHGNRTAPQNVAVEAQAGQPQPAPRQVIVQEEPVYQEPRVVVGETESPTAQPAPVAVTEVERPRYQALSAAQVEDLVGSIALYPDPLLAQILPASTYPMEVIEADQWLRDNPRWTDRDLDAQPWEECVKAMVQYPEVLRTMSDHAAWTRSLGLAFLYQQQDVMSAIQRLRMRAVEAENLRDTPEQQIVVVEREVVILPADPAVIYVPTYDPKVIYVRQPVRPRVTFVKHCASAHLVAGFDWSRRTIVVGGSWHFGFEMRDHRWTRRPVEAKKVEVRIWTHNDRKARPQPPRITSRDLPREKVVAPRQAPQQPVVKHQPPSRTEPTRRPVVRGEAKPGVVPGIRTEPKLHEQPAGRNQPVVRPEPTQRTQPKAREEMPSPVTKTPLLPKAVEPTEKAPPQVDRPSGNRTRAVEIKAEPKAQPKSPVMDSPKPKVQPKPSPEVREVKPLAPVKVSEPAKKPVPQKEIKTYARTRPVEIKAEPKLQPKPPVMDGPKPIVQPKRSLEIREIKPLPPVKVSEPDKKAEPARTDTPQPKVETRKTALTPASKPEPTKQVSSKPATGIGKDQSQKDREKKDTDKKSDKRR